jgi:hypothetical protein
MTVRLLGTNGAMDQELSEPEIEAAEHLASEHRHDDVDAAGLADHVRKVHKLDVAEHLSASTVGGLHDRVHQQADAADDPDE